MPRRVRPRSRTRRPPVGSGRARLWLASLVIGSAAAGLVEGGWGLNGPIAHAHQPTLSQTTTIHPAAFTDASADPPARPQIVAAEVDARRAQLAASRAARDEADRPRTVMPIRGATLTSAYGGRWGTTHYGLDLAAPMLTPEYAAADGVVLRAGAASGFGLAVYVLHDNGDVTVYGHMEKILVTAGQTVRAGETIALLGNRGQSTGPHLHFEVYQGGLDGRRVNPARWLRERGVAV